MCCSGFAPSNLFYCISTKTFTLPNVVLLLSFVSQRKHSGHFLDLWGTTTSYRHCLKIASGICLTKSKKWHFEGLTLLKGTFIFPKAPCYCGAFYLESAHSGSLLKICPFVVFCNKELAIQFGLQFRCSIHFDMSQKWHTELIKYDLGARIETQKFIHPSTHFFKLLI